MLLLFTFVFEYLPSSAGSVYWLMLKLYYSLEEIKCELNIQPKAYLPLSRSENICTFNFNYTMILKPCKKDK